MIVDSLPSYAHGGQNCTGAVIRQFSADTQVRNNLNATATDTSIYWYGFSIPNYQIPDSIMTTRLKVTLDNITFPPVSATAFLADQGRRQSVRLVAHLL